MEEGREYHRLKEKDKIKIESMGSDGVGPLPANSRRKSSVMYNYYSDSSVLPDKTKELKYTSIKEISFWFYLVEILTFSINYIFDRFTIIFAFIMYNLNGDELSVEIIGFAFTWGYFYFLFTRDFQEPIGIICGPYYSKNDFKNYKIFKFRLIFFNILLIILNFLIFLVTVKPLFKLIQIEEENIDMYASETMYFCIFYFMFESFTNFIRGCFFIIIEIKVKLPKC